LRRTHYEVHDDLKQLTAKDYPIKVKQ